MAPTFLLSCTPRSPKLLSADHTNAREGARNLREGCCHAGRCLRKARARPNCRRTTQVAAARQQLHTRPDGLRVNRRARACHPSNGKSTRGLGIGGECVWADECASNATTADKLSARAWCRGVDRNGEQTLSTVERRHGTGRTSGPCKTPFGLRGSRLATRK